MATTTVLIRLRTCWASSTRQQTTSNNAATTAKTSSFSNRSKWTQRWKKSTWMTSRMTCKTWIKRIWSRIVRASVTLSSATRRWWSILCMRCKTSSTDCRVSQNIRWLKSTTSGSLAPWNGLSSSWVQITRRRTCRRCSENNIRIWTSSSSMLVILSSRIAMKWWTPGNRCHLTFRMLVMWIIWKLWIRGIDRALEGAPKKAAEAPLQKRIAESRDQNAISTSISISLKTICCTIWISCARKHRRDSWSLSNSANSKARKTSTK